MFSCGILCHKMDYVFLGLTDLTILENPHAPIFVNPHAHYGWELIFMETIMVTLLSMDENL
jgi:hypothetical protein